MVRPIRMCADAASALLLAGVLLMVYWVDQRGLITSPPVPDDGNSGATGTGTEPPKPKLAVAPGKFDQMGKLLKTLGEGYQFVDVDESELTDLSKITKYDAIFLTCGEPTGAPAPAITKALRGYVEKHGGTLYASDLRYDILQAAFPEFVDLKAVAQGVQKDLIATVVDPDLRNVLGAVEMPLHFDQEEWRPAAFGGPAVTVYLKGSFKINGGVTIEAPLLVRFPCGKGTVLFTSFHNEKQKSDLVPKLLKYLVLSTVTAGVESNATQEMVRGGFSPKTKSLLSVTPGEQSVARTFQHAKAGTLKFSLGFEPRGARLRLEVVSPKGESRVEQGESTITIDVPDAAPGQWQYTAVAEKVPYENFPYLLTVGEAGGPDTTAVAAAPNPGSARRTARRSSSRRSPWARSTGPGWARPGSA